MQLAGQACETEQYKTHFCTFKLVLKRYTTDRRKYKARIGIMIYTAIE